MGRRNAKMWLSLALASITCAAMIASILFFPKIKIKNRFFDTYPLIVLLGAMLMLVFGLVSIRAVFSSFVADTAVNPLKILVLFISMTVLSVFLDAVGFFFYVANVVLHRFGTSQKKLFLTLYLTVSILTVFTSNDIIILTFTPFICYFCKNARVSPLPYLVCEFVAANTWSMALMIGNPTNIYLAGSADIDFMSYLSVMWLPTLLCGIVSFAVLFLVFRKDLSAQMAKDMARSHIFMNKPLLVLGLLHLGACTVLLALGGYLGWEMWLISLIAVFSLVISVLIVSRLQRKEPAALHTCLLRAPWTLIPFMLGMFVIVLALSEQGVTSALCALLSNVTPLLSYGVFSTLLCNLMNNIPMSVLMGSVVAEQGSLAALYATVIGSNLGALLTPIGALAGIMWGAMLKAQGIRMRYLDFVKNGVIIVIPACAASLLGLLIVL